MTELSTAANDDDGDNADAMVALSSELDSALTALNRKLIELHSRLKVHCITMVAIPIVISIFHGLQFPSWMISLILGWSR